jgi:nucleosome binding factor SPN SPT16 subunit
VVTLECCISFCALLGAAGFADLFSVKDDGEVLNAKKAAFLASKVMQSFVVEKIEDIIDKNKKVKHAKLSGEWGG